MLITPELLLKFSSFRHLSEDQQHNLLGIGEVKLFQSMPGEKIISRGSNDAYSFFLVSGSLKLIAKDGQTAIIKADSDSAMQPITQLKPRQYDVLANSQVSYLRINSEVLDELNSKKTQKTVAGIQVENEPGNADIYFQLYHDIKNDHVVLPSLTNVAGRIHKTIVQTKAMNATLLGQLVLADPAITAKLIKLSAVAKQGEQPKRNGEEILQVIERLGISKTIEVVKIFSEKDIFRPVSELHHQVIKDLWHETIQISAIASVLAEEFEHLDPKKAQIVGLIHNIGAILILDCLGKDKTFVEDAKQMRGIISELSNNISAMLLDKWGFSESFVIAAKDAQYWKRTNEGKLLDYCDLIIIAKLLSTVATPHVENMPVFTELAVFRKLNWGNNGIVQGLDVLKRARQKMRNILQVMNK